MGKKRRQAGLVAEVVAKIEELGLSYRAGAKLFGLPVSAIYSYNKRRKKGKAESGSPGHRGGSGGVLESGEGAGGDGCTKAASLEDQGHSSGNAGEKQARVPEAVAEVVREYRRTHPNHGFRRIEQELRRRHLVVVPRKQIRAILKEAGLLETLDSSFDREEQAAKGSRRFEASYPGELYQMDVTYIYLEGLPTFYLVVVVDDYSRFCVGVRLCLDQRGSTLIGVLHDVCVRHGYPTKLLTDQGGAFYTWSLRQTAFQEYLDAHQIEHLVCNPHSPQTQGKVERLIQTIQRELFGQERLVGMAEAVNRLEAYIQGYNFDRAHQSLSGQTPAERFYGVRGETARMEAALVSRKLDLEQGFLVFRMQGQTLALVCGREGLEVYLDGRLLNGASDTPDVA